MPNRRRCQALCAGACSFRRGFTLVELMTVIAIITLLIGILVPALGKARDSAKNTKTRGTLKAIGDGLEIFKTDNPGEVRGEGYPSSAAADDPTAEEVQTIYGAQWLVRYLMGKDLNGYVAKKSGRGVPANRVVAPNDPFAQEGWYDMAPTAANPHAPLQRVGPYLSSAAVKVVAPKDLPGAENVAGGSGGNTITDKSKEAFVILDTYEYPILYYAANTILASDASAPIATFDGSQRGIYNFRDNAMFTGSCARAVCTVPPWDFAGVGDDPATFHHGITQFGTANTAEVPNHVTVAAPDNRTSFVSYIMDSEIYQATGGAGNTNAARPPSIVPHNKSSFLLITAGKDGLYGTTDDVTNFD